MCSIWTISAGICGVWVEIGKEDVWMQVRRRKHADYGTIKFLLFQECVELYLHS